MSNVGQQKIVHSDYPQTRWQLAPCCVVESKGKLPL